MRACVRACVRVCVRRRAFLLVAPIETLSFPVFILLPLLLFLLLKYLAQAYASWYLVCHRTGIDPPRLRHWQYSRPAHVGCPISKSLLLLLLLAESWLYALTRRTLTLVVSCRVSLNCVSPNGDRSATPSALAVLPPSSHELRLLKLLSLLRLLVESWLYVLIRRTPALAASCSSVDCVSPDGDRSATHLTLVVLSSGSCVVCIFVGFLLFGLIAATRCAPPPSHLVLHDVALAQWSLGAPLIRNLLPPRSLTAAAAAVFRACSLVVEQVPHVTVGGTLGGVDAAARCSCLLLCSLRRTPLF